MSFLAKLEEAEQEIELIEEELDFAFLESLEDDEVDALLSELKEDEDVTDEEYEEVQEALKRRVSSTGAVKRVRSKAVRKRRATITTGRSKTKLKQSARKAARTRRRNPGTTRKANRKRKRAMRYRKQRGIK